MRLNWLLLLLAGLLLIVPSCHGRAERQAPHKKIKQVRHVSAMDGHVHELRARKLLLPVEGTDPENWKNSFYSARGGGKLHHAVDMRAPMRTPIRAVDNGTIARMNNGKRGGISIYQTDPAQKFNYYYCHLHSYASGLKAGSKVRRGQIIGYVGSTGHSSGPHLHFQISKITNPTKLWAGLPINPYQIFGTGTSRTGTSVASNSVDEPSSHIAVSRASKSQFSRARSSQSAIRKIAAVSRKRGSKNALGRHLIASARNNVRGGRGPVGRHVLASVSSSRVRHAWKNTKKSAKNNSVIAMSRKQRTLLARKRSSQVIARVHAGHSTVHSKRSGAKFWKNAKVALTHNVRYSRRLTKVARNRPAYRSASIKPAGRIAVTAQPNRTKS